jgi:transcriptional regulator with XRE-family HTH domain
MLVVGLIAMKQQSANFGHKRQVDFGLYLKDLRERRGLSRTQVADELNINIWEIEKGNRSISDERLMQLAIKYREPLGEMLMKKYWPQLPLLTGIMEPTKLVADLHKYLYPEEVERVTVYIASVLRKRVTANKS